MPDATVPAHQRRQERNTRILALREQGVGPAEIARRVGVYVSTVSKVLRDATATGDGPDPIEVAHTVRERLHARFIRHFSQQDVRARLTSQLDIRDSLYWPVLAEIETRLFPEHQADDGEQVRKGLIPVGGLERVAPLWLIQFGNRIAP